MAASTKHIRKVRQAKAGPAGSPEAALKALRERGREMSDEERKEYIRQAIQMIDPAELADRLITRVPSLGGQAASAPRRRPKDEDTDLELEDDLDLEDRDDTETAQSAAQGSTSRRAAELLGDLVLPDDAIGDIEDKEIGDDDEAAEPRHLRSATQSG